MTNLLKTDFKRVLKDKLFWVVCFLGIGFSLLTPLLYVMLVSTLEGDISELAAMGLMINAKGLFFDAFSPGNNLGLVAPILLAVVLWKDFGQGTVRNKIIGGYSRTSIALSMYVVSLTTLFGLVLMHALLSLGIGLMFLPYQSTAFTVADFGYLLASVGLELLLYVFIAALVCFLCMTAKSTGLVIVGYIAVVMGLSTIASILQMAPLLSPSDWSDSSRKVVEFFNGINVFNSSTWIGRGTSYEFKDLLYGVLPPVLGGGALFGLGWTVFKRKDLK